MFWYTLVILIIYSLVSLSNIAKEKDGGRAVLTTVVSIIMAIPYIYLLMIL